MSSCFYSRAIKDDDDGTVYWDAKILLEFLGIPNWPLKTGDESSDVRYDPAPVIFRMASYLGAFPFQSELAPSALTFDAMVKVVMILTKRYAHIKMLDGDRDGWIRLLFCSLANVSSRRLNDPTPDLNEVDGQTDGLNTISSQISGESSPTLPTTAMSERSTSSLVDPSAGTHDEGSETNSESPAGSGTSDYDPLACSAASISSDTLQPLLAFLLLIAPLQPADLVSQYTAGLDEDSVDSIFDQLDVMMAKFMAASSGSDIGFEAFARVVKESFPYLFDPLSALFEIFVLGRLERHGSGEEPVPSPGPTSVMNDKKPVLKSILLRGSFESSIINRANLAQLSFFLPTSHPVANLFHNGTTLYPVFSSSAHGESLTSFSHHVLTWRAPSLLLLKGNVIHDEDDTKADDITIGAYIPQSWKAYSSWTSAPTQRSDSLDLSELPYLFSLSPRHQVLRGNPSAHKLQSNMPVCHFSSKTGIAIGCRLPPSSRLTVTSPEPQGGGSLMINPALDTATLVISQLNGEGVFLPPSRPHHASVRRTIKTTVSIYDLEVWGVTEADGTSATSPQQQYPSPTSGSAAHAAFNSPRRRSTTDAVARQQSEWQFEAREAERRRSIHRNVGGGDSETQSGRALLEMAGLLPASGYRSIR